MTARILVVDDIEANVKLLEAKLNKEYYEVVTARSGPEALSILDQSPIDVVLLDVMMPDMDGFEVCTRIKNNPKHAFIPIIMVTALSDVSDRVQGLKVGAEDFLTKPINDMSLFARIRSVLRLKLLNDELRARDRTETELGLQDQETFLNFITTDEANIILIDDDLAECHRISNNLSNLNHKVLETLDYKNIIELIKEKQPDLIIVSAQLSDMDGLRICSQIKSTIELRNLPILILVEESEHDLLIKALDLGVNDYIISPFDENELVARVSTQIRRKRYQDALKTNFKKSITLAVTDSLTGLYNRRYFDAHYLNLLKKCEQEARPMSLVMIDIDHFKNINDTYGHQAGDEVLKQVAKLISEGIRLSDLAARYGGEEFVVILYNTPIHNAALVGERLRASVDSSDFELPGESQVKSIKVTISLGICAVNLVKESLNMVEIADKALYQAKESGRNKVIVKEVEL